ncbi:hypothetical protein [Shinella pollutisoli]|uniref:Uncharacterized protein n=1 Tax=Shinella pollutisoli TaxID=2250594 RepID=A0ABV7DP87_9HYPH|nr:hypothetical protein [Shinella pollutisoli]
MAEVFVLPDADESRVRLEAARIARLRRQITRSNALRDLDRQIIREAAAAGLRRGAAFHRADLFLDAVKRRMDELERLRGECIITRNIVPLRRKGAVA